MTLATPLSNAARWLCAVLLPAALWSAASRRYRPCATAVTMNSKAATRCSSPVSCAAIAWRYRKRSSGHGTLEPVRHVGAAHQIIGGNIGLLRQGQQGGAGDHQMALDAQIAQRMATQQLSGEQGPLEALSEREGRRWADIMSFTINMEQVGDTIERVLQDVEDKKVRKNRSFSDAGMAEIAHLHDALIANLRLAMSVFLDGQVRDAQRLLEEKARFRDLEHEYAATHLARLRGNTAQSIETSSLHIDLISDLKRINSHICSIAYPILESAGALSKTRIRPSQLIEPGDTR